MCVQVWHAMTYVILEFNFEITYAVDFQKISQTTQDNMIQHLKWVAVTRGTPSILENYTNYLFIFRMEYFWNFLMRSQRMPTPKHTLFYYNCNRCISKYEQIEMLGLVEFVACNMFSCYVFTSAKLRDETVSTSVKNYSIYLQNSSLSTFQQILVNLIINAITFSFCCSSETRAPISNEFQNDRSCTAVEFLLI